MDKKIFVYLATFFPIRKKSQESIVNVLYLTQYNRDAFHINFLFFTKEVISKLYDTLFLTHTKR